MKQNLLKTWLMLVCLILGVGTSWGAKITNYTSIVSGKKYYIGATTGSTDYYLSVDGSSTSTSIAGTAVTNQSSATAFVFEGSGTSWTIKFDGTSNYLGLKSSKDNGKVQVVSSAATFTLSNQSGKIRLTIGNYSIEKNNSGTQFGSYANTQTDIWLEEVASGDKYTVSVANNIDNGTVTATPTSAAEGATVTLTATPASGYEFGSWNVTDASSNSITVTDNKFTMPAANVNVNATFNAIAARPANEIFYESFDTNDGTGGNDGSWSGSIASSDINQDNDGWTYEKGSGAKECAKFGTGSGLGSATTPALGQACNATLTFKAAAWNGGSESTTLKLSVIGGGSISPTTVTLTKGAWDIYNVTLTNLTASSKIKFEGNSTSNSRFFLDEVSIVKTSDVAPIKNLSSIAVNTAPLKVAYTEGEMFAPAGLVITKTYDDASTEDLVYTGNESAFTFSPSLTTALQTSDASVQITVGGKSTTQAITVNAIPSHTAHFSVNGTINNGDDSTVKEGQAIVFPADPADINGKKFQGWTKTVGYSNATTAPSDLCKSATMENADVTYYAVFASVNGEATPDKWQITPLAELTGSDIFVIANGTNAISSANKTSTAPSAVSITISVGKITSAVSEDIKWNISGDAENGYTFYPNGDNTTWLYCNTTASSGSNNNIRVGIGARKVWKPDTNGYLKTNDSYTARYLSFYTSGSDFRSYINTDNSAFAPTFYKFVPGEEPYSDYCTTVSAPTPANTINFVATNEDGYWATFSSTKDVIFDATDVVVYTVAVDENSLVMIEADNNSLSCVTDKSKDDGWVAGYYVQAGAAVLINSVDESVTYYDIDTDPYTPNDLNEISTDPEYNMLRPASVAKEATGYKFYKLAYGDEAFTLSTLGFYWGAADGAAFSSREGSAYLAVPTLSGAAVRGFAFNGGEATAITEVKSEELRVKNLNYYNLNGQRINGNVKGIVIVNGKKILK